MYFDSIIAACQAHGFSPRILHDVRTVAAQVAFVSSGQGIALVPSMLRKLAPDNVVLRPLVEALDVVTIAVAWSTRSTNPLVAGALEALSERRGSGGRTKPAIRTSAVGTAKMHVN